MNWKYYEPKFEYEEIFQDVAWAWVGHKRFAYDLIANIKPKRIVELGTHKGTSLFSFAQSVKDNQINVEINAVDTWVGEKHAGFYGEEIINEVKEIKEKYYGNVNINLLRKTFDEALDDFEDKSIDILHIDGLHTYDAIKHDFDTWIDKVSDDGIVLFHDIKVQEKDFGVYKFWAELKQKYKTIEFTHSFGLGVLFLNKNTAKQFLDIENELQRHYLYLHEIIRIGNINQKEQIIKQKNIELNQKEQIIQQKNTELNQKEQVIQQRIQELNHANNQIKQKNQQINMMQSSKFWKMRNVYIHYKNGIKQGIKDPKLFFVFLKKRCRKSKLFVKRKFQKIKKYAKFNSPRCFYCFLDGILSKRNLNEYKKCNTIKFSKDCDPSVSIIIPVYNQLPYTLNTLHSIKKFVKKVSFEIIIIDDCSSDSTRRIFKKMQNVKYIRNQKNIGFLKSCNKAVKVASGKYIVLLNNDTEVHANWLESMIDIFETYHKVGLVGSKLVYPDGRLQEAGGIVWKNENVWNYGRLEDPKHYEFNYVKDVDYCSAASIMVKKELWSKLGGFDEIFAPAYYEDTDLSFRIREAGFRTIYQPQSVVTHYEGISCGTDIKRGIKKYQEVNKATFFCRWKTVLNQENYDSTKNESFLARDKTNSNKIVLYLENNVPTYDQDAGSFITFEYLKAMRSMGYKIIFWPKNLAKNKYSEDLQQLGIEVVYGNINFHSFIKQNGKYIKSVIIARPDISNKFLLTVKKETGAKIIYIAHDLHFLRMRRENKINKNSYTHKEIKDLYNIEKKACESSDVSLFFSDKEIEVVLQEFPKSNPRLLPWIQEGHDKCIKTKERNSVIFLGGYNHSPNVDAVRWLYNEIFPLIKNEKIIFYILGSNMPQEIQNLNNDRFRCIGFVTNKELHKYLCKAKIFIAPLRYGAGFKGKVAMAMSYGIPVVTTGIGAEGVGLHSNQNAIIAETSEEFANSIMRLYNQDKLWGKISKNSKKHVVENFSVSNAKKYISNILTNF